jgi:sugar phosphate isomerase/epimerase
MQSTTIAAALTGLSVPLRAQTQGLRFKYAICNEVFEKQDFAAACRVAKSAGFSGLEIAPFTLANHVDDISAARRRELSDIMRSEGLEFAGLHWLLITPKWLHVTTEDAETRRKSWDYVRKLSDFCADLGKGGIMVFGSPAQRKSTGNTPEQARKHFVDGLASVASHAGDRGVTILIESLPRKDTDVVNTLAEAVQIVKEIGQPAIQTMFDYHNTLNETEPLDVLVRRYFQYIRHIHINEMDGRHPGTGNLDFVPVLKVLSDLNYSRWVSLEVFDFKAGAEKIARDTIEYLRRIDPQLRKT